MFPIFYINMKSSPDRRDFMEQQFAQMGLNATRIEAVTPADIPPEIVKRYTDARRYRWLMPAELACSMSHIRALTAIADSGQWGCVFEDDAVISPNLPAFLEAFAATPMNLDILRLESVRSAMRVAPQSDLQLGAFSTARIYDWLAGSAGYLAHPAAARRAAAHKSMMTLFADEALFDGFRPLCEVLRIRQLVPALCEQSQDISSDLTPHRKAREQLELAHYWHHTRRRFLRVMHQDVWVGSRKTWKALRGVRKRIVAIAGPADAI